MFGSVSLRAPGCSPAAEERMQRGAAEVKGQYDGHFSSLQRFWMEFCKYLAVSCCRWWIFLTRVMVMGLG